MGWNDIDREYSIGYCKPPEKTRFKSGISGNPKGRPNGQRGHSAILKEELAKKIRVTEGGKSVSITKGEALIKQLVNKGIQGDLKAIGMLNVLIQVVELKDEEKLKLFKNISVDDDEIINAFVKANAARIK